MYHVVVCSRCKYVWIVKDRPKTSQCGKCRRTRKFKLLKKYHKTTDKDEAKLARAFYQSRVHDQAERFDEALEAGVLEEDLDAFVSETEYLDLQGLDGDAVDEAVENILSPSNRRSEIDIIREAFHELDDPDVNDVVEYAREYDVSVENAILKLEGLVRDGTIDPGSFQKSDIDAKIDEVFESPAAEDPPVNEDVNREPGEGSSHYDILIQAVEDHGDDSVETILEQAESSGMDRQKAVISLEKLALSGRIDPGIDLQAISGKRMSILGDTAVPERECRNSVAATEPESTEEEPNPEPTKLSQREIMVKAIEDQEKPTEDDVIEFAEMQGLSRDKARKLLDKMRHFGEVQETSNYTLRLL